MPTLTLQHIEPFSLLPAGALAELEAAVEERVFPAGSYVFRQDDPPTGYLYVIRHGLVEIVALAPGNVEMVVDYRRDGGFFGGTPFLAADPYTAGARTVRETTCILVPDETLGAVAARYPQLRSYFTRALLSRVRNLYAEMVDEHAGSMAQIEAFPFQKRLSEIMSRQVEICPASSDVEEVARLLAGTESGAVLVGDGPEALQGIITEHDLVAKVLARQHSEAAVTTAAQAMTPNPLTMPPETYMYEAVAFMTGHGIRHLPVVSDGEVIGLVTAGELMSFRSQNAMLLVGGAREAETLEELGRIRAETVRIARALLGDARSPVEIMEILSHIHRGILHRGFELVLQDLHAAGEEIPEVRYCLFLMGSGGRGEMLLDPDQDHGLIIEDCPHAEQARVDGFFARLSDRLVAAYAEIGYPRCRGGVMASNPLWRGRWEEWQQRLAAWIKVPEPQRVRYSNNFFDFHHLAGDERLCRRLRGLVNKLIGEFPPFLYHLMELNFSHKVPLGLMGGFVLEKDPEHRGTVSTKQAGSLFIVDCLRIFSLEQQLEATNTTERLQALVKRKVFSRETADHLQAAFQAFSYLRLRQEIELLEQGREPSHYLDPDSLSKNEQDLLKEAFRATGKLQDATKRHFSKLVG